MADIKHVTVMMRIDDTARADISLTPDRSYYRFATDSSIEDGQLAPIAGFEHVAQAVVDAARPLEGERPLPSDLRFQLFVNNVLTPAGATEESLSRVVEVLSPLTPEFSFLQGFIAR